MHPNPAILQPYSEMAYFEVPTRLRRRHRTLSARLHPRAQSTDATRPACRVKLEQRPHVLRVHQPPPPIVGPAAGGSSAPAGRRDTRRSAVRPAEDGARHGRCTWRWRVRGGGRAKARAPAPILKHERVGEGCLREHTAGGSVKAQGVGHKSGFSAPGRAHRWQRPPQAAALRHHVLRPRTITCGRCFLWIAPFSSGGAGDSSAMQTNVLRAAGEQSSTIGRAERGSDVRGGSGGRTDGARQRCCTRRGDCMQRSVALSSAIFRR